MFAVCVGLQREAGRVSDSAGFYVAYLWSCHISDTVREIVVDELKRLISTDAELRE